MFLQAFGNILSYAIFYGGGAIVESDLGNSTESTPTFRDLSICGRNDCQDPNITDQNSDRYEPASQTLIYILVGVMSGFVVVAMTIHFFLTKPIDTTLKTQGETEKSCSVKRQEVKTIKDISVEKNDCFFQK